MKPRVEVLRIDSTIVYHALNKEHGAVRRQL